MIDRNTTTMKNIQKLTKGDIVIFPFQLDGKGPIMPQIEDINNIDTQGNFIFKFYIHHFDGSDILITEVVKPNSILAIQKNISTSKKNWKDDFHIINNNPILGKLG